MIGGIRKTSVISRGMDVTTIAVTGAMTAATTSVVGMTDTTGGMTIVLDIDIAQTSIADRGLAPGRHGAAGIGCPRHITRALIASMTIDAAGCAAHHGAITGCA